MNVPKIWVELGNWEFRIQCRKHPKYKLLRKPTSKCTQCRELWKMVEEARYEEARS